eukprot:SAG31_NODE_11313_length_1043_cov_0.897246_1_plen_26_part_10
MGRALQSQNIVSDPILLMPKQELAAA